MLEDMLDKAKEELNDLRHLPPHSIYIIYINKYIYIYDVLYIILYI